MEMNETQLEIKRWVARLDQVAIEYEAKWSIGFLQKNCSKDFQAKWQRQNEKLQDALLAQDIRTVQDLAEGTIRAWGALEKDVLAQGIEPPENDVWEIELDDGFKFAVTKTSYNARKESKEGLTVFSLEEVARMVQAQYNDVFKVKQKFDGAELKAVNRSHSDDILPF